MNLTISQLKNKWKKESEHYATKEVGSGVQKFVKDLLKSDELLKLKDGLGSTKLENRHNEFTEESKTKAARHVDIIIYINSDIIIPVEVEKFGNIEAGIDQLFQYQLDLDKKLGILTDGFTWRFYNNTYLLKEYNLDQILEETEIFLEFWKEYTKPEYYYVSFFEERGQLEMLPEKISVEDKRRDFFHDITTLIRGFKNKLKIEGYFKELESKEQRAKKAIEITYAYIIQFILYKTLVDNDFDDYRSEYQKKVAKIHESLKKNNYAHILGIINGISTDISKNIYKPFSKEQELIDQKLLYLFHNVENSLHDVSPWLDIFVFIKKYNFANVKNDIFGYIYENYLKELYEETKKGQYFTDPAIVNFMLEQIGYTADEIKKRVGNKPEENSISIIDPSCGSGTFLYSAVDRLIEGVPDGTLAASEKVEELINNNIFGLDIAEFPLYLAEMNILMRMLPLIINEKYNNPIDKKIKVFLTKDSIAEFIDAGLNNTINDLAVAGQAGQLSIFTKARELGYTSYVRHEGDLAEMKTSMRPPRRRFDYVIGNPPYIGYNECSKQGVSIFNLMKEKEGKIKLNNIYGVNLHSIPNNQKKYAPKPNLYSFFIALGLSLLKDDGRLCYIIPQTILTAGDLDVLRYHLAEFTTIEKIVTFSGQMFVGRGLRQNKPVPTSSLVFVVRKKAPSSAHQVHVIHYKDPNDDIEKCLINISLGKKIAKKNIKQHDLLVNVVNWNFIKQSKEFLDFYDFYKKNSEDISIYYNHVQAELKFKSKFYFDVGFVLEKSSMTSQKNGEMYELLDFKDLHGYSRFIPSEFYPEDKAKIKLTQNSQGYISLDQKYKIIWSIKNPDRFCFTEHPIIFYMGKASIICSHNKEEVLYLLSLLNSPINNLILESNLKNENEKEFLLPIKVIKEFIRVPRIIPDNQFIKDEVIKYTGEMLALEHVVLGGLVDFSKVMVQKFDGVKIKDENLILIKGEEKIKCLIKKDITLVKKVVEVKFAGTELLKEEKINLSDLKCLPAIDFDRQKQLKDYMDDLVFALYFSVPIKAIGLDKAKAIKEACEKNKFYSVVSGK